MQPLFIEWQRFASSSLSLLMLKHLDENKQQWQSIADEELTRSKTVQACDSCSRNVTQASIEVKEVHDETETSVHCELVSTCDTSSPQTAYHSGGCAASCDDESVTCHKPKQVESRRGSLPTCDTVLPASAGRRRNSAPVISQCAALTVKKYLLATLAEHSSSFYSQNGSSESERFFPNSHFGSVKHHVMDPQHVLHPRKSSWTAVAPFNAAINTCVGIEGRPRDRRSNSHALVFRQCLLAGRLPGRRFSSPAVGQDFCTSRDSECVPLLSAVIPSSTVCSHSALVNWFVVFVVST